MSGATLGDVKVYAEDVETLAPGCWLNDAVIAYLFEHFSRQPQPGVVLLEPPATFTAAMVGDATALREMWSVSSTPGATPLTAQLLAADIVLMPVSNNDDSMVAGGGGHWSLLVFRRRAASCGAPRFEHYDSMEQANAPSAKLIMSACAPLLFDKAPARLQLVRMTSPQQENGFDCGVYALAVAELLCAAPAAGGAAPSPAVTDAVRALTPAAVTAKRQSWLELLRSALTN